MTGLRWERAPLLQHNSSLNDSLGNHRLILNNHVLLWKSFWRTMNTCDLHRKQDLFEVIKATNSHFIVEQQQ